MFVFVCKFTLLLFFCLSSFAAIGQSTPYKSLRVKNDVVQISYQFMDKASWQKEAEFTHLITRAFDIYKDIFGGLPRDLEGKKYNDFVVKVKQAKHLGGEADPNLIILTWSENTMFGYANWKALLLHELFHLWNAESIRYSTSKEHWFNEGFSEYYAYRTAAQMGLLSPEDAISMAAQPVGYYSSAKGLGSISMRDAGKNNKLKFENYFLIYNGGWVAAMTLDHDIRKRTSGRRSLDDLMKWLYANFPREKKLYDVKDIAIGLRTISDIDYQTYFDDYVLGTKVIPVADYFDLGRAAWDLKFSKAPRNQHSYLFQTLGIK